MKHAHILLTGVAVLAVLLVLSGIHPFDRTTWLLEIFPILIALPVLLVTYRHFPLTNLLYVCIFLHSIVLMTGGTYSYARVPLGFHIADLLHLTRNPYDKIGHFFQGFVPVLIAREIFIRCQYVRGRKMIAFLSICVVLAISASYELIEWMSAVLLGRGADEFLGTQGDPWDTQSDMLFALIGAVVAVSLLSRLHDRQLDHMANKC
jgi:putative membrane protein